MTVRQLLYRPGWQLPRLPGLRSPHWPGLRRSRFPRKLAFRPQLRLPRLRCPRLRWPRLRWPGLRGPQLHRPRWLRLDVLAALVLWCTAGLVLYTSYLHVSRTVPVNSDGASNALQAWAMLHGNLLLRGWRLSDVSFYPTELPQYMLIELCRGLGPDDVHVAAAMTYTLLILLAARLAKGTATGGAGLARAAIAAGIMLAPQQSSAALLLLSPDHVGSSVPVLLAWILLDHGGRRWYVPITVGLLLTLAVAADSVTIITGAAPLAAIGAVRGYQVVVRQRQRLRAAWYELCLVAAGLAAVEAASRILAAITSHGGFYLWPVDNQLAPFSQLPGHLSLLIQGVVLLFGANFFGHNLGLVVTLAALHLAGIGLAGWAVCAALRRFAAADLVVQLLVTGILLSLAGYLFGCKIGDTATTREMAAVLPLSAALAGRLLAGRLIRARILQGLLIVLAGYLISLVRVVVQPPVPAQNAALVAWLSAHHLDSGLSGYWQANGATLEDEGVQIRALAIAGDTVVRGDWETQSNWYNPARHQANFVVLTDSSPGGSMFPSVSAVRATFGQPASIYYVGPYAILVWDKNLLTMLQ